MKSILLTACVLLLGSSFAQNYVTIPDANFAKYLKEVVPNAINGNQLDTSSADVKNLKKIDAEARAIKNLEGVQYFKGLDTLDVGNGDFFPNESKNVLSTLPKLPENLKVLICGNTYMDSLPVLPKQLSVLKCYSNNLKKLPILPEHLSYLNCNFNQLTELILNNELDSIDCDLNKISYINKFPDSLIRFNGDLNELETLPEFNKRLEMIIVSRNKLTSLPNLPESLYALECWGNKLTNLPSLPKKLFLLECGWNQLTNLPELPITLYEMSVVGNSITKLPKLPINIAYLFVDYNQLSELPLLPENLKIFGCSHNQLKTLPQLPNEIVGISCSNNILTKLPELTPHLQVLLCGHNQLTEIPNFYDSLFILSCNNNLLSYLPPLQKLNKLICDSNQINCFPNFPTTMKDGMLFTSNYSYSILLAMENNALFTNAPLLSIKNNPFKCLPNYISAMDSITLAYPLCSDNDPINNPYKCSNGQYGILGSTSFDSNKNCHKDSLETSLANIPVVLLDSANNLVSQTYTAMNGVYQFPVGANNYNVQIDTTNLPFSALCPKGGDTTISLSNTSIFAKDVNFNLTCKEGFDVGIRSVATSGIVFPGQPHNLYVTAGDMSNWFGRHCAEGISGQLQLTVTGPVKYVATAGTKTPTINGNVYTFEISDFGIVNFTEDFGLSFVTDTTAKAGDQVCVNAQITPKNGDYNVANNTYDYCYSVINSHDPNLKEVYPANFKPGYDGYLTYTVHFQNTGSAQAFNIRLVDTLDAKLDLKTFEVLNYSHANTVSLTGNVMRVKYPNIMLSDSTTNEKASHGFIQYRIKPLAPISEEQQIKNTAYIYFDYNDAIVTNTTVSKANKSLGIHEEKELGLRVYPNPTENLLTFERTNHTINTVNVSIVSVNGQVLFSNSFDLSNKQTVDLTNFAPGVYFVNVQNEEATDVIKVIKK